MKGRECGEPVCRIRPAKVFDWRPSGIYDEAYLDYLRKLLESMTEHGLVAYVVSRQALRIRPSLTSTGLSVPPPRRLVTALRRIRCACVDAPSRRL